MNKRNLVVLGLTLLLSACGFQLRGTGDVEFGLKEIDLQARNSYGETVQQLESLLQSNGVRVTPNAKYSLNRAREQTRQRTEQAMLSTYGSEADLRRVFAERQEVLDNNLKTAEYNVTSLRESLVALLSAAGDRELAGAKVADKQAEAIRKRHAQLQAQQRLQAGLVQQQQALKAEIDSTLQRYRELKGLVPADAPAG